MAERSPWSWRDLPLFLMPIAIVVVAALTMGFSCGPDDDPCEQDRFGCEDDDPNDFTYDDSCTLTGELQVEVRQGEGEFTSFAPNEVPELHSGSQGGQHIFAALRVANAATDQYDKLSAQIALEEQIDCSLAPDVFDTGSLTDMQDMDASDADSDTSEPEPQVCWRVVDQRTLILGAGRDLRVVDGVVEEYGILMQTFFPDAPLRLRVSVEDPCRRTGSGTHEFRR